MAFRLFNKKKHINSARSTKTYLGLDESGEITSFNKAPIYEGHEESTHYMADNNKRTAWPSITEDSSGGYKKQSRKQARKAGEVYKFLTKKKTREFAREGNWKK